MPFFAHKSALAPGGLLAFVFALFPAGPYESAAHGAFPGPALVFFLMEWDFFAGFPFSGRADVL
ncbi:MAG: hypothetical protein ACLUGG_11855 [Oscillospiraceae bacterium]